MQNSNLYSPFIKSLNITHSPSSFVCLAVLPALRATTSEESVPKIKPEDILTQSSSSSETETLSKPLHETAPSSGLETESQNRIRLLTQQMKMFVLTLFVLYFYISYL